MPTIINSTFNGNRARMFGGGMYNDSSSPAITHSSFSGNAANTGGGVYNWNSSPTVSHCTFSGNSAGGGGGMANLGGRSTVTNCMFSGNSATGQVGYGGGMYNNGTSSTVRYCTFRENIANHGGGMFNDFSSPTVTDCMFSVNSARSGGGMLNIYWSSPRVTNCTFSGNAAKPEGGGGGLLFSSHSHAWLMNCLFTQNTAGRGGAMSIIFDSDPTITNCTFGGNSAGEGGGMYIYNNSKPNLSNCILWGNTDSNGTGLTSQIRNVASSPEVNYSIIQGGWSGEGVIDADPMFVDPLGPDGVSDTDDDNLRLMPGSPGINAGNNEAVPRDVADIDGDGDTMEATPFDLDRHPRILCGTVDMGAYEFGIGDVNCDQIVDLTIDYAAWEGCMTGPGEPGPPVYPPACKPFDAFFDGWIDVRDFAGIQNAFSSTD